MNQKIKSKKTEKEVKDLALAIDALEDEKLVLENQLKRALADYQNLEKSTLKRIEMMEFQSRKALVEGFVPVLDALTMAIKARDELKALGDDEKAWADGICATLESLEKVLTEIGLKKFVPNKGDIFDPSLHEAVTAIDKGEKGQIYDLIQPGYMLDNIVIRPARVVVSK